MSTSEVDVMVKAVLHADDLHNEAPYTGMNPEQIDRRYAQWMVEYLRENGWLLAKVVE